MELFLFVTHIGSIELDFTLRKKRAIRVRGRPVIRVIVEPLRYSQFKTHLINISFTFAEFIASVEGIKISSNRMGQLMYYIDRRVKCGSYLLVARQFGEVGKIYSELVTTGGTDLKFGTPTPLFALNIEDNERRNRFLVTKDGERFLVIVREETKSLVRR